MKKIGFLLLIISTFACQKEFPSPTDPLAGVTATLTEKWRYDYPAGENLMWVDAGEYDVLYITNEPKSNDNLNIYRFSLTGELLSKVTVNDPILWAKELFNPEDFERKGSWIKHSDRFLIHQSTGVFHYFYKPENGDTDKPFDPHLSGANTAFVQQYIDQQQIGIYHWDLTTNVKRLVNTLSKTSYFAVGELDNNLSILNFEHNPIYLKVDHLFHVDGYEYSLIGTQMNRDGLIRNWSTPSLFGGDRYSLSSPKGLTDNNLFFIMTGKEFHCIDLHKNKEIWSVKLNDYVNKNAVVEGDKIFIMAGYKTYCLDKNTGNTLWQVSNDDSYKNIETNSKYMALVNFIKIDPNVILGDVTSHLQIFEIRKGHNVYSNNNIFQRSTLPINDARKGIQRAMDMRDNRLYIADDVSFGVYELK